MHDGLPLRLDATAADLRGVGRLLMASFGSLEQHRRRLRAGHLPLESLLSSSLCYFMDAVPRLVSEKGAAHRVRLTGVVGSAWDSLCLDLLSL